MKQPFLTIITRCYKRPDRLKKNMQSLKNQMDQDWQQIFIVDDVGKGLHWANKQFYVHRSRAKGKYVMLMDDDDYIQSNEFIASLKTTVEVNNCPDVIMLRTRICGAIYPSDEFWRKYPIAGHIGGGCIITKNEVFQKYIESFGAPRMGDFYYIKSIFDEGKYNIYWWDNVGIISEKWSHAKPGTGNVAVPREIYGEYG